MTIIERAPSLPDEALVLLTLADCVCAEVTMTGGGPLCWCGLHAGAEVSWEYCGECSGAMCGMGWVRLMSVFPYQAFPTPVIDEHCVNPLALAVEVGTLRCIPTLPNGEPLDQETMAEVAMTQAADLYAVYRGIQCCDLTIPGGPRDKRFAIQAYNPLGPVGGCVGGTWTIFLAVD
jgi:hypothetical protein